VRPGAAGKHQVSNTTQAQPQNELTRLARGDSAREQGAWALETGALGARRFVPTGVDSCQEEGFAPCAVQVYAATGSPSARPPRACWIMSSRRSGLNGSTSTPKQSRCSPGCTAPCAATRMTGTSGAAARNRPTV